MTPAHVDESIAKALKGKSKLDKKILGIRGFSTPTMRHLFNNLMSFQKEDGLVYLEVGAFFGASCCAAAYKNLGLTTMIVEDYSQDFSQSGARESLPRDILRVTPLTGHIELIEADCFNMDLSRITSPVDVIFYDAEHSEANQARALPHFFDILSDTFLSIVDDWEWDTVRRGTLTGLDALQDKMDIVQQWKLETGRPDDAIWHNGVLISLCRKK